MKLPVPANDALPSNGQALNFEPNWRGIGIIMSRKLILPNLTDQPFTLAQFNVLMSQHAEPELKKPALLYLAYSAFTDPLLGAQDKAGNVSFQLAAPEFKLPDKLIVSARESYKELSQLSTKTMNTVLLHCSEYGLPNQPSLNEPARIKALPPEDAAALWAEAMEEESWLSSRNHIIHKAGFSVQEFSKAGQALSRATHRAGVAMAKYGAGNSTDKPHS